jgi:hypothetical protein
MQKESKRKPLSNAVIACPGNGYTRFPIDNTHTGRAQMTRCNGLLAAITKQQILPQQVVNPKGNITELKQEIDIPERAACKFVRAWSALSSISHTKAMQQASLHTPCVSMRFQCFILPSVPPAWQRRKLVHNHFPFAQSFLGARSQYQIYG